MMTSTTKKERESRTLANKTQPEEETGARGGNINSQIAFITGITALRKEKEGKERCTGGKHYGSTFSV